MRDPCSVLWDVLWDDLATMELTQGKKDQQKAPPSRLILYQKTRSTDTKEQVHVVKCCRDTHQALEVYSSIERAMITYGQNLSMVSFQMIFLFHLCTPLVFALYVSYFDIFLLFSSKFSKV